ncbi:transposase [Heyndrickxia coagulans]
MPLFVGIDVSSKNLDACLMDGMGETLATQTVTNNLPGASELRDAILQHAEADDTIQIAMEATSVYLCFSYYYYIFTSPLISIFPSHFKKFCECP